MRKLLAGERQGSFVQVAVLAAVFAIAVAALGLMLAYRSAWKHAQQGVYQLCLQREHYDRQMHSLEQADADEQRSLLGDTVSPRAHAALTRKLARDEAYLATPIVDGCELVKP